MRLTVCPQPAMLATMPNVFETNWPSKSLAKGDKLLVPSASKKRRTLWARAQMPVWETPQTLNFEATSSPWWLLQKGQVLDVLARPSKHAGLVWVQVSFRQGECVGWILSEHAYACPRHRARKKETPVTMEKPRTPRLSDLRPGVVFEHNGEMAIVQSWTTDRLPTPKELACVRIEQQSGTKDIWLSQLQMP